jgi:hypothetical protein
MLVLLGFHWRILDSQGYFVTLFVHGIGGIIFTVVETFLQTISDK